MDNPFINLEQLPEILTIVKEINKKFEFNSDKRWLSTKEVATYLDYSEDRIHKFKNTEFFENKHFYKRSGKLLFDKNEIDKWVMGIDQDNTNYDNSNEIVNEIVNSILASK